MHIIDINCDVGEGINNEHLLMPYISSCNIACGGHFGNAETITKTIEIAIKNNVLIGAHPSFPDKENFGRKVIDISDKDLKESIKNQLELFLDQLANFNQKMHHIKPHGALYNLIAVDKSTANLFIEITKKYLRNCFLYVPYNSAVEKIAIQNNIKINYEAFADRNYNENLMLVSRAKEIALITNSEEVFKHVFLMIKNQKVKTISGAEKFIKADTFCLHGDTENAIEIAKGLSERLKKEGIRIGI
ncbi:5-oxoprolinase subunit PxpA [uncultured Polaribacter sp.]|uniref:5-oxoprolinase subunit PxpA n=1 Tax=uncultured Polaribacter sp. TaxID=174711 RepID=UPI0026317CD9|nr:5-oxoprolinase subunit PxpA [uncultured Polaribacter sp.]